MLMNPSRMRLLYLQGIHEAGPDRQLPHTAAVTASHETGPGTTNTARTAGRLVGSQLTNGITGMSGCSDKSHLMSIELAYKLTPHHGMQSCQCNWCFVTAWTQLSGYLRCLAGGTLFSWGLDDLYRLGHTGGDNSAPETTLPHLQVTLLLLCFMRNVHSSLSPQAVIHRLQACTPSTGLTHPDNLRNLQTCFCSASLCHLYMAVSSHCCAVMCACRFYLLLPADTPCCSQQMGRYCQWAQTTVQVVVVMAVHPWISQDNWEG